MTIWESQFGETESGMGGARGWGRGREWVCNGDRGSVWEDGEVPEMEVVTVAPPHNMLRPMNPILKNGEMTKTMFCVFYHNF